MTAVYYCQQALKKTRNKEVSFLMFLKALSSSRIVRSRIAKMAYFFAGPDLFWFVAFMPRGAKSKQIMSRDHYSYYCFWKIPGPSACHYFFCEPAIFYRGRLLPARVIISFVFTTLFRHAIANAYVIKSCQNTLYKKLIFGRFICLLHFVPIVLVTKLKIIKWKNNAFT